MLEMTYFCVELLQLIVSRSETELEVQRYGMKKNTLTVDPIMRQDELWLRQREKPPKSVFDKKAQLSLTNPRDACEKFARFT